MDSFLRHSVFLIALLAVMPQLPAGKTNGKQQLEQEKFELEKARIEGDLRVRQEELKLRREELQAKQNADRRQSFSASTVTIVGALMGLIGAGIVALIQARSN